MSIYLLNVHWSFCRNTLKNIFYNLSAFCLSSIKSLSYYPMFLISLIPVVSFGQTSVLSGLFCKISHGPSESWALFTGHSSCGGPVVFLHIGHILCSALVSPPPPNQLCSLVIEAVRLPITLSTPFFVFSLILSCTPKRSVRSLPHFKNAEVFPFSFLWCILYRDCPDAIRAPPYPALVPCLIPAPSTSGQKFSGFPVPPHSAFPSEEWWTSFGDEIGHTAKTRWWWGLLKRNNEKRNQCVWEVIQD